MCLTPREKWSCGLFDRPLVVGCSTGHKPRPLHVNEWDLSQNKKINYTSNTIFQNMDSSSPDCRWLMPVGRRWWGKPTRHFLSSRRRLRLTDPAIRGRSRRRPWGKPTHRRLLPLVRGESQPAVRGSLGPQPAEAPSSPPAPAVGWSSQPVMVSPAGRGRIWPDCDPRSF